MYHEPHNTESIIALFESSFHKLAEIGNDGNIGMTGITMWKQTIQQQNVNLLSIESGSSTWCSPLWGIKPCVTQAI